METRVSPHLNVIYPPKYIFPCFFDLFLFVADSVFMRYDCKYQDGTKMDARDAIKESMRLAIQASSEVTEKRMQWPNVLNFEKVSQASVCPA